VTDGGPEEPRPSVVGRLQRGLEAVYRVETGLDVDVFMVGEEARHRALASGTTRRPREQLLVSEAEGELGLALFLDRRTLANLDRHDPAAGLSEANFGDFCLAVEGVSHFIYVARCAASDRSVTALELELQAEVDKFVSCTLLSSGHDPGALRERLYEGDLADDLDEAERDRYRTANDEAHRYARSLERRFIQAGHLGAMLAELRRFYRLTLTDKLHHISRAA
jgi:hypothetical protein